MSHFTVLVVTDEAPTNEVLTKALQPYHEFECTGIDDEFVQDVDKTEELRANFESRTETRYRDADGALHNPYEDRFYRDPTDEEAKKIGPISGTGSGHGISWPSKDWGDGRGYRVKVHYVPDGMEKVEVPAKDVQSFAEFIGGWSGRKVVPFGKRPNTSEKGPHKYGYILVDEAGEVVQVIDRTNPNKKWDWWKIGGRWEGMLRSKGTRLKADSARFGAIDLDAMREDAMQTRQNQVNEVRANVNVARTAFGLAPMEEIEAAHAALKAAEALWRSRPEPRPRGEDFEAFVKAQPNGEAALSYRKNAGFWKIPDTEPGQTLAQWIEDVTPFQTFAILKDGKWMERGKMGWWACVSNENPDWDAAYAAELATIRPDQWVTVVDCHI